jgi:predicted dehydrogenase
MSSSPPIRLALLGAGIFARDAHIPSLLKLRDRFEIVAVYSQHGQRAATLVQNLPAPAESTADLEGLLARNDIEAVDIVLPIDILPVIVAQALSAGKHVISEKPAAPDVTTGRQLLAHYARHADRVWMVGENFRYEPAYQAARDSIRQGDIGKPLMMSWTLHTPFRPGETKYYETNWRRENRFPGGLVMDGGVHHAAAMRLLLGEVASLSAVGTQTQPDLPPVDTLSTSLLFESGVVGSYTVTYATGSPWTRALRVVGEAGALSVEPGLVEITRGNETRLIDLPAQQGVQNELAAFAAAIREGQPHANAPEEGVQDVAVIEAMLRAADTGERVEVERISSG